MSFVLYNTVRDTSPLKGTAKAIHMALAHRADKDGICYPRQETIAADVGCSIRYVRKVLAQMVELGLVKITQRVWPGKKAGNYHQYQMISEPEQSSGSEGSSSSGSEGSSSSGSYKEQPEEQSEEENRSAPTARSEPNHQATTSGSEEQDASMPYNFAVRSAQPESEIEEQDRKGWREKTQPKKAKIVAPPNSQRRCIWKFDQGAKAVGHPWYAIGLLRKTISQLRHGEDKAERPYTYTEIEVILDVFFTKHAQHLRSDTRDIAAAFTYLLPRIQKEARGLLESDAQVRHDDHKRTASQMWAEATA